VLTRYALQAIIPFDGKSNLSHGSLTISKTYKLPSTSYSKHLFKYKPSSKTPRSVQNQADFPSALGLRNFGTVGWVSGMTFEIDSTGTQPRVWLAKAM
jgi:hypothetical protein